MNKWISVEDELPKEGQEVIVRCISKDGKFYSISEAQYCTLPRSSNPETEWYSWHIRIFCEGYVYMTISEDKIYNPASRENFYIGRITHWMPLPDAPEVVCKSTKKRLEIQEGDDGY